MPLGTEVNIGPGDVVFDGVAAPFPLKRAQPPVFGLGYVSCGQNGWMDEDATWYGSRPRPRPHCIRRGPSSPRRGTAPPLFGPCLLWPRPPILATAELLLGHRLVIFTCVRTSVPSQKVFFRFRSNLVNG